MFETLASLTGGGGLSAGGGGPSSAGGGTNRSGFDNSGWNVNFGSGSVSSSASGALGGALQYVLIGVGVLMLWRMTRKGR